VNQPDVDPILQFHGFATIPCTSTGDEIGFL
jgi:hypothetical protein